VRAKKDYFLSVRISKDMKAELRAAAERRERTSSWLAHDILERWLLAERKRRSK